MGGEDCASGNSHDDPTNRRKGVAKDWGQGRAFGAEHGPFRDAATVLLRADLRRRYE